MMLRPRPPSQERPSSRGWLMITYYNLLLPLLVLLLLAGDAGIPLPRSVSALTLNIPSRASAAEVVHGSSQQQPLQLATDQTPRKKTVPKDEQPGMIARPLGGTLQALLDAIQVMQDKYFEVFTGTWPESIDWTAAVLGTHVSATLSSVASSIDYSQTACSEILGWENTVDRYFAHTSIFYFGENAFSLRNQAYDDMLWVVLGWLENLKFMELYSYTHWEPARSTASEKFGGSWHGMQFSPAAAHRARIFYDIASEGWDTELCGGGMIWSPYLTPYKNAITNELFIAASISMYLYFPGDKNDSPYMVSAPGLYKPRDPKHLEMAIIAYDWLKDSQMKNDAGLFADGFHIKGWHRFRNGTIVPGTGNCDELDPMVYTYNQGVLLTGCRGLWMATGHRNYLEEGHELVESVIKATGWPWSDGEWGGLGRDGVLEEYCDHRGDCSQNGHTFKGIFFHHLAEFCRPLWPHEEDFVTGTIWGGLDHATYQYHQTRCARYGAWIQHNAQAALVTRDQEGRFGTWWGRRFPDFESRNLPSIPLEEDAVDYRNAGVPTANEQPANATWTSDEICLDDESCLQRLSLVQKPLSRTAGCGCEDDEVNDRGRGRTVETQSGGLAVLRALWQWESLLGKEGQQ